MTTPPFATVLVANRGEIAVRVIRTLRRLGIRSIAVASDADLDAVHARLADEMVRIGPARAADSYLDVDRVVRAALDTGAEAIHPGYGFLSENADLARACATAGIVFIGPGERALEVMGDKIRAKRHVAASGVPVVPGVAQSDDGDDDEFVARAADIGFPMLVKPSAGGGGKGMQLVTSIDELRDGIATARRVARGAFGDDTLLVERFIEQPRHIEVQVLADSHGAVVHLGERECSLQRRHQKVVEEAPSPLLDAATRERIGRAACDAAASVDYRGAGTVEFLVSASRPDEFFFIEMNTRLQVEHPVTELVTGIDLVEQQLRIAAGEPLPFAQGDIRLTGHAIEARVYAEAPERGFLPSTGTIVAYREPSGDGVRVDSGVADGSEVTAHYDPMLAKVITHGADRAEALDRLAKALADAVVLGVDTNLGFLQRLLADAAVRAGELDTGLIDRMPSPERAPIAADILRSAAAVVLADAAGGSRDHGHGRADAASPLWRSASGWRVGAHRSRSVWFDLDGAVIEAEPAASTAQLPDRDAVLAEADADAEAVSDLTVARGDDGAIWVHAGGATARLMPLDRAARLARSLDAVQRAHGPMAPELRAPMPGTVTLVAVHDGAHVAAGETVVAIEAMKMEHRITAPIAGVVRLSVASGAQVRRDEIVARIEPVAAPDHANPATSVDPADHAASAHHASVATTPHEERGAP